MSDALRYRIYWRDEGRDNFMCVDPGFPEVDEAEEVHVVLASAYDALAREVEELKTKLKIWHARDDAIMDKHGVDTDGYIKRLERQLAEAQQQIAELESENEKLLHRGLEEGEARDKAEQRLAALDASFRFQKDRSDKAEARLAETRGLVRDLTTVLEKRNKRLAEAEKALVTEENLRAGYHDENCELIGKLAALTAALDQAMHELGIPGPGYPAPVTNAYNILNEALAAAGRP